MKKSKNTRTAILAVVLLGLLVYGYKIMFIQEDLPAEENTVSSERVEALLSQIQNINFDTSVINDENFKSLKSIAVPLPNLPVGRSNPFSAVR